MRLRKGFKSFGREVGIKLVLSMVIVLIGTFVAVHAFMYRVMSEDYGRLLDLSMDGIKWELETYRSEVLSDVENFLKRRVRPQDVVYIVKDNKPVYNIENFSEELLRKITMRPVYVYKDRVFWNLVRGDVIAGVELGEDFLRRLSKNLKGNGFVVVDAGGRFIVPYFVDSEKLKEELAGKFGRFSLRFGENEYIVGSLNLYGLRIYPFLSTLIFKEIFRSLVWTLLISFLAGLGIITLISIRIARYLSSNLKMVLDGFERLREGNFEFFEIKSEDELGMMMAEFNITVAVLRDAMEKLRLAKEMAEEASKSKSMFLASVSHEIRTPLNSILGFTELLLKEEKDPKKREYLSTIYKSGEHLLSVINEILDLSKIEAGRMELTFERYNPVKLVEEVVRMYQPIALKKGINITMRVEGKPPKEAIGDPFRIKQVLINLVSNAVRFTEEGYVVLSLKRDGDSLIYTVEDTGIGIPKEKIDTIFEPFTQADASVSRKFGGTGLGLTIAKKLANLMKGDIWIESEVGKGTKVFFKIPIEVVKEEEVRRKMITEPDLALVYLENGELKDFVVAMFKELGFTVEEMESMDDLAAALEEKVPRVVVLEANTTADVKGKMREMNTVAFLPPGSSKVSLRNVMFIPSDLPQNQIKSEILGFLGISLKERLRIGIVEDNEVNRVLIKKMLQKLLKDHEVVEFENGEEVVKAFKEGEDLDLILMDARMPVMDGFTATKVLREEGYEGVVIMISASVGREDIRRAVEAGCDDFVPKPVKSDILGLSIWKFFPKATKKLEVKEKAEVGDGEKNGKDLIIAALEKLKSEMEMGDEVALGMMKDYLKFLKRKLEDLKKAVENRDQAAARRVGHDLSGSGEMYGLPEISKLGDAIRRFAKEDDFRSLDTLVEKLEDAIKRYEEGMKEVQS